MLSGTDRDTMTASMRIVVLLAFVLSCVHALYFHIAETERKCFIEEIPENTMVTGEAF